MDLVEQLQDAVAAGHKEMFLPDRASETLLMGGDPVWVQDEIPVSCPKCNGPAKLISQLCCEVSRSSDDSEKFYLPFGSYGDGYLFACEDECSQDATYFAWQTM